MTLLTVFPENYFLEGIRNIDRFKGTNKSILFTEDDIDRLEKIISKVKKELNTEEVLGTTVVIRDDDGDIQDGTYESWLTLHNTEFDLPTNTNFKEGDKVEIFARKTK